MHLFDGAFNKVQVLQLRCRDIGGYSVTRSIPGQGSNDLCEETREERDCEDLEDVFEWVWIGCDGLTFSSIE